MNNWKDSAKLFFDKRASFGQASLSLEQLCYMSGRDPRIWGTRQAQQELIDDISFALEVKKENSVLEVGSGSGYIAAALAPEVFRYSGVDMSPEALRVAQSLNIDNAEFYEAEGESLPFEDAQFDRALLYNVINNIPSFDGVAPLLREMYRVICPGGRVLIGCVPDAAQDERFLERAQIVTQDLALEFGQVNPQKIFAGQSRYSGIVSWLNRIVRERGSEFKDDGQISCYYFSRDDFSLLAEEIGAELNFKAVRGRSPYAEYRFHAVLTKPLN